MDKKTKIKREGLKFEFSDIESDFSEATMDKKLTHSSSTHTISQKIVEIEKKISAALIELKNGEYHQKIIDLNLDVDKTIDVIVLDILKQDIKQLKKISINIIEVKDENNPLSKEKLYAKIKIPVSLYSDDN